MTLLAEAKVQGSHASGRGHAPEIDGRLEQDLAYHLPAPLAIDDAALRGGILV